MSHSPEFEAAAQAILDVMLNQALGLVRAGHPQGVVMWAMASAAGNLAAIFCERGHLSVVLSHMDVSMRNAAAMQALAQERPAGSA